MVQTSSYCSNFGPQECDHRLGLVCKERIVYLSRVFVEEGHVTTNNFTVTFAFFRQISLNSEFSERGRTPRIQESSFVDIRRQLNCVIDLFHSFRPHFVKVLEQRNMTFVRHESDHDLSRKVSCGSLNALCKIEIKFACIGRYGANYHFEVLWESKDHIKEFFKEKLVILKQKVDNQNLSLA